MELVTTTTACRVEGADRVVTLLSSANTEQQGEKIRQEHWALQMNYNM